MLEIFSHAGDCPCIILICGREEEDVYAFYGSHLYHILGVILRTPSSISISMKITP